ncbi:coiled-coil domain-containing protein 157 [Trichomycterus rosablanca]|uniref:coiled-coil domain-containing protein 157 n=1 Tax=Trichomycterus rosablanca TaxID=2290929 RepID=UPI002F3534A9
MAHLLGGQECVESLRRDVVDLQGAVVEVFSRTGPVRCSSWKFPDKLGCNVDLVALLQQYDYTEGELEFNQHSHIVLLELVIDRLILLLQSFNAYTEMMIGGQKTCHSAQTGAPVSIGPVVKRYWDSLIQFCSQQRQMRTEGACRLDSSSFPRPSTSKSQRASSSSSLQSSPPGPVIVPTQSRSVSCQTVESALVPCDACARVQATLKDSATVLASLCRSLGLPCSLWCLLEAVDETLQLGRLSACDVALWACEQKKDLGHIQKHVTQVKATSDSLTERMQRVKNEKKNLRLELEEVQKKARSEEEERRRMEEQWENKLREMKIRGDEELTRVQEEHEKLKQGAAGLEVKLSELNAELELLSETHQSLEHERDSLLEKVHEHCLQEIRWREMEEKMRELEMELTSTQKLLDKESAKYQSAQRQHEALQVKQRSLLERVDALVQQCDELQCRLDECEDEKAELNNTLTHTTQERDTLQQQLTQHQYQYQSLNEDKEKQCVRVCELEESLSRLTEDLHQAVEREKVLVAFPELNPHHAPPQSTGDVVADMEQQVKANTFRIQALERENVSLTNSLARLIHSSSRTNLFTPPDITGGAAGRPESRTSDENRSERVQERQVTSSAPSTSSVLHQQTLRLSVVPDPEETYSKLRRAVRTRSAGSNRRRK